MPELRQNRFTKEWVIIATERAKRPDQMIVKREAKPLEPYVANCPFCPGNEAQAPPELARHPGDGAWQVRVVPNKFAALSRDGEPVRTIHRSRRSMNGVGLHEVITETPLHNTTTALLSDAQVAEIIRMYKYRFHAAHTDSRVAHVTLFKNHGSAGGASLEHPHSQMIATPIISSQVRMRMFEAMRYYDEFGGCIFCQVMEEELGEQTRIVLTTDHFVAMEPYASGTPFATHIYPRRHMASFGEISVAEIQDLGRVLKAVLAKLYWGLENPDFNYTVRTGPPEAEGEKHYHWYISIIPRLTKVAGFELGSGMFINVVLPETAAEFLRNTDVSARG